MGLFGTNTGQSTASRTAELALPAGSTVTDRDLDQLLRGWAMGDLTGRRPLVLPAGLTWTGPRAGTAAEGVEGRWVYSMTWERSAPAPEPPGDPVLDSEWEAAIRLAGWLYDAGRRDDEPPDGGPRSYAVAAVEGLARRTGGQVRVAGERWEEPGDPEAVWSVYVTTPPDPATVAGAVATVLPGLVAATTGSPSWVLETPDGLGLWLEEVDLEGAESWDDVGDPSWAAVGAIQALRSATLWAIRVEGADDIADAEARAALDLVASTCAQALGGIACDAEGFPV